MKQENTNLPLWKVLNEQRGNKGWRQGQTLPTKQTNKWNKKQWEDNDEVEKRMLFSHFREEDDGRSRIRIAEFENEIDAQYTALAVNNLHHLAEAIIDVLNKLTVNKDATAEWRKNGGEEAVERAAKALFRIS